MIVHLHADTQCVEIELLGERIASEELSRALARVPAGWPVRFFRGDVPAPRAPRD